MFSQGATAVASIPSLEHADLTPVDQSTKRSRRARTSFGTYNVKALSDTAVHAPEKYCKTVKDKFEAGERTIGSILNAVGTNKNRNGLIFSSIRPKPIHARKMTRLTDDPDASEDDDSGVETKLRIFNEDQALRLLEPMPISDDDVPVFLLENVTVRHPSREFANVLLYSRPGTSIEIIGQLAEVDQQFEHLLKEFEVIKARGRRKEQVVTYGGQFIRLRGIVDYSIGWNPNTIWVRSRSGFFEIHPAKEYEPTFERMITAVGLHFIAEQAHENNANLGTNARVWKSDDVFDLLRDYTQKIAASGYSFHELVDICKEHAPFFLAQWGLKIKQSMGNSHQGLRINWSGSPFYQYVKDGCSNLSFDPSMRRGSADSGFSDLFDIEEVLPPPPIHNVASIKQQPDAGGRRQKRNSSPPGSNSRPTTPGVPSNVDRKVLSMVRPFHGAYISSAFPNGLPSDADNLTSILVVLYHAVESGRTSATSISVSNLGHLMYLDFSEERRQACLYIVHHFGRQIRAHLPEKWMKSPLWKDLDPRNPPKVKEDELVSAMAYINGTKNFKHRRQAKKNIESRLSRQRIIPQSESWSDSEEKKPALPALNPFDNSTPAVAVKKDSIPLHLRGRDISKISNSSSQSPLPTPDEIEAKHGVLPQFKNKAEQDAYLIRRLLVAGTMSDQMVATEAAKDAKAGKRIKRSGL